VIVSKRRRTAHAVMSARLFGGKRRRRPMPKQHPPIALERAYGRAVVALVVPRIRAALAPLYRELPTLLASSARERAHRADATRVDAGEGRRVRELLEAARSSLRQSITTQEITALAQEYAARVSGYQRIQLGRQIQAVLGVDIPTVDTRLPPLVDAFADANVGLIKDIGERVATQVEGIVTRGVQDGARHEDIAEELEALGFGEERALLIARDQVGKLYGQVNATRQTDLGVRSFIWRSSGDERVRDLHDEIDGDEFTYEEGGHPTEGLPGEPILCRCWADPVFDDLESEIDAAAEEPSTAEE